MRGRTLTRGVERMGAILGLTLVCAPAIGCELFPGPVTERRALTGQGFDEPEPSGESPLDAPATPGEVRKKVAAIFGAMVRLDAGRTPWYVTGDFNADGSRDVAVALRPSALSVGDLNDPGGRWIIEDVRPGTGARPARVEVTDALLAIIHGHGPAGWRDPLARHVWLLRHAAGEGMAVRSMDGRPAGDVITVARDGRPGQLVWSGARYAWTPR